MGVDPDEVDRSGGEAVVKLHFRRAAVQGAARSDGSDRLVVGAVDARAAFVSLLPGPGALGDVQCGLDLVGLSEVCGQLASAGLAGGTGGTD